MADQLWNRAERDLCVLVTAVVPDLIVWEHSSRVAKLSSAIAALPEVANQPVERQALTTAALYHDAGWVLQVHSGEIKPAELLLRPTNDMQRELAADWIPQRLDKIIGPGVIEQAARIIRHCNNRRTELLEAQIAIPALLRRLPDLALTTDEFPWIDSLVFRGVRSLPLRFRRE
jgi:hypothetical protein